MESFTSFFIFLGVMILFAVVAYFLHKRSANNHNHGGQTQEVSRQYKPSEPTMPSRVATPPQKARVPTMEEKEARVRHLNTLIQSLAPLSKNQIWDVENIKDNVEDYLSDDDVQYIAKQLYTSLFATTIWDLHEKIKNCQLANDQIIKILESGTYNIIDTFMEYHTKSTTWTMSSLLLDKIISQNPLWIFRFTNYSKDVLMTIINRLSAYELLGYRMKPTTPDESIEDSFVDLQKSTDEDEITIEYYESADTDMVRFLEQYYPTETELRQKAFAKILAGSANIIATINRVDNLSDDEIKQIIARDYSAEIKELFEVCNVSSITNCFPPLYAIKIALQLVECDYEDEMKENYDFSGISMSTYQEVIASLSADELLGYDDRGNGNYDIIKLFEDNSIDDQTLRQTAFEKMLTSTNVDDAIGRWENVMENEIATIMERKVDTEISALFARDDSDTIISNLPQEVAIKIALELVYPDSAQTVKEEYVFDNDKAFLTVISELSADELLGFRNVLENPELRENDADYDIIRLIEEEMHDDDTLRKAAFAKICEAKDMSDAIARWDTVTEEEVKVIMERKNEDEINALFGRDNSEDIICDLPEDVAIKIRLQLIYADSSEKVENNYRFADENAFIKVIDELSANELLGCKLDPNDPDSFYNDADYDIIKLIEDEMQDNENLRKRAFAKICESKDMSAAIGRWDTVTEEEVKVIMERKDEDEINALFGRDNSEDIICDLPEDVAIRIRLQLIYADSSETVENNYRFADENAFIKVIDELSANELLGFKLDPNDPDSFYNDADYDIIKLIEDEMSDNENLRKRAFAKICESKDMSAAIGRWDSIADVEIAVIVKRGIAEEMTALLGRDDADSANMPDNFIISQHLLEDDETIRDEFSSRMDDKKFADKVKKMFKGKSPKELSDDEKEGAVEDLSDEKLIRVKLFLTDIDECSFDSDDVANEFSERMTNNEEFEQNVKTLIAQLS